MKLKKIKSKIYSTSILVFSFIMILPISISGNAANDSMLTDKSNYVKDDLTENSDTILKENINIQTEEEGITEEPVVISSDDSIDNVNTNLDLAVEGTTIDYTMETINKKFRNAPGGTVKINIAQRCDWFYHPNYPRTAIAAMALKVCGSDGDTPIMQERQRVAYCLEYQKSSPSVSVTQGSSYTTNKALVLCMLLGERYWGGGMTDTRTEFATGDSAMDYYITQIAIHILNGEMTYDMWNSAATLGVSVNGSQWIYNFIAPRIQNLVNYCNDSSHWNNMFGSDAVYYGTDLTSTPSGFGWNSEIYDGVAGYSTHAYDINLKDSLGVNIGEWITAVDIQTDCPEVKVLRQGATTQQWDGYRLWIPSKAYETYQRTGKVIKIQLTVTVPGGFTSFAFTPANNAYYQKVTILTMAENNYHNIVITPQVNLEKTGPQTADLQVNKRIQVYKDVIINGASVRIDEITWAHGNPIFLVDVEGADLLGMMHKYTVPFEFTKEYVENHTDSSGYVTLSHTFKNIPIGTAYKISEHSVLRYRLESIQTDCSNITVNKDYAAANLVQQPVGSSVTFTNYKYRWDDYSHNDLKNNSIEMVIPG